MIRMCSNHIHDYGCRGFAERLSYCNPVKSCSSGGKTRIRVAVNRVSRQRFLLSAPVLYGPRSVYSPHAAVIL